MTLAIRESHAALLEMTPAFPSLVIAAAKLIQLADEHMFSAIMKYLGSSLTIKRELLTLCP